MGSVLKLINGRLLVAIIAYLALIVGGIMLGNWLFASFRVQEAGLPMTGLLWILIPVFIIYFITSALPFIPASEIGFGLLIIFGGAIAPFVFITSVAAIFTAFMIGRFVSIRKIARFLEYFGLERAPAFLRRLRHLSGKERLAFLIKESPKKLGPMLLKYRYVGIIALMNVPGNAVIGGGGGIAFVAGLSKLFTPWGFATSTAIAVMPYPLFFFLSWCFGY